VRSGVDTCRYVHSVNFANVFNESDYNGHKCIHTDTHIFTHTVNDHVFQPVALLQCRRKFLTHGMLNFSCRNQVEQQLINVTCVQEEYKAEITIKTTQTAIPRKCLNHKSSIKKCNLSEMVNMHIHTYIHTQDISVDSLSDN